MSEKVQMHTTSVNIPQPWVEKMEELIRRGHYVNQSELIRIAIRDLLKYEFERLIES